MRSTFFQAHTTGNLPPKLNGINRNVPRNVQRAARASSGYDYQDPVVPTPGDALMQSRRDILLPGVIIMSVVQKHCRNDTDNLAIMSIQLSVLDMGSSVVIAWLLSVVCLQLWVTVWRLGSRHLWTY